MHSPDEINVLTLLTQYCSSVWYYFECFPTDVAYVLFSGNKFTPLRHEIYLFILHYLQLFIFRLVNTRSGKTLAPASNLALTNVPFVFRLAVHSSSATTMSIVPIKTSSELVLMSSSLSSMVCRLLPSGIIHWIFVYSLMCLALPWIVLVAKEHADHALFLLHIHFEWLLPFCLKPLFFGYSRFSVTPTALRHYFPLMSFILNQTSCTVWEIPATLTRVNLWSPNSLSLNVLPQISFIV